ncbi:MAG: serine/threonine-protein kinase [Polyangiales bacterium]
MESKDPKTFGKYTILRKLGQGGMGTVFEAEHQHLHKRVALKVMHESVAEKPGGSERFIREGRAAAKVHHPNIVDVTDVGVQDGTLYLVMELLSGEDLAARIQREKTLSITDAIDLVLPVCAAVFTMHTHGLIHRDLKPENIFLARVPGAATTPKILDFGICRVEDPTAPNGLSTTGGLVGTPNYMAPEQVTGRRSDARSDQHALGVILYEMLCGHRPYSGETMLELLSNIAEGQFIDPRTHRAELPHALANAISRALAPTPEDRFESVRALGDALAPFASDRGRGFWSDAFEQGSTAPPSEREHRPLDATIDAGEGRLVTDVPSDQTLAGSETPAPRSRAKRPTSTAIVAASLLALLAVSATAALARRGSQPTVETPAPSRSTAETTRPTTPSTPPRESAPPHESAPNVREASPSLSVADAAAPASSAMTVSTAISPARSQRIRTTPATTSSALPASRPTGATGATGPTNSPTTTSRPVINGAPIVD